MDNINCLDKLFFADILKKSKELNPEIRLDFVDKKDAVTLSLE